MGSFAKAGPRGGARVIAAASPRNFDFLRGLGAEEVIEAVFPLERAREAFERGLSRHAPQGSLEL